MSTELAIREQGALTVSDLTKRRDRIQEVLKQVMKPGVDYGKIPGCGDKPALLKAGAEKILSTFKLAAKPEAEHIIDLGDSTCRRVRVIAPIVHIDSGVVVGHGVGECSSEEEKYAWKAAVCPEEWNEADPDDRREKWKRGKNGGKNYQVKQIRTIPADVSNTILKMAKKRAVVDGTLTATAASDIFEQGEDVTGDEDEGFNREGISDQATEAKKSDLPAVPVMRQWAGQWAGKPVTDLPLEALKEFLPGVEKEIKDAKYKNFKERNLQLRDAMKARIAELEGQPNLIHTLMQKIEACTDPGVLVDLEAEIEESKGEIGDGNYKGLVEVLKQQKQKIEKK